MNDYFREGSSRRRPEGCEHEDEEDEELKKAKKKEPLSLDEILAKKKAEEAAKSKVSKNRSVESAVTCLANFILILKLLSSRIARFPHERRTCC